MKPIHWTNAHLRLILMASSQRWTALQKALSSHDEVYIVNIKFVFARQDQEMWELGSLARLGTQY